MSTKRTTVAGLGFVLLSACAYGITPALFKLAYRAHLDELSLIGLRSAAAAVLVAAAAWVIREPGIPPRAATRLVALGAGLYGPQMWLYFAALHWLDTTVAVAAAYVYPTIVAVIVAVRRRRPPPAVEVALIGVAALGVAAIALSGGPARADPLGLALVLTAALLYAGYVVVAASVTVDLPTLGSTAWMLAGTAVATLGAAAATGRLALPAGPTAWTYLLVHGLVVVPVGLVAFYAGLRRLGPVRTSLVDNLQPVIAVTVGSTVLGERLTLSRALGITLVSIAVVGMPAAAARRKTVGPKGNDPVGVPRRSPE